MKTQVFTYPVFKIWWFLDGQVGVPANFMLFTSCDDGRRDLLRKGLEGKAFSVVPMILTQYDLGLGIF